MNRSSSSTSSHGPLSPPLRPALKHTSRPPTPSPGTTPLIDPEPTSPSQVPLSLSSSHSGSTETGHPTGLGLTKTPSGYTNKVSFDTFENQDASTMFSFTLQVKSENYKRSRNTRVFLVAASGDESGMQALEWAVESLVQCGDELVVVRGFDADDLRKDMQDELREEAKDLMTFVLEKNSEVEARSLSVIVEFVAGKVTETIERMIALYRPDSLVVGTRGQRGALKAWGAALGAPGMGSVSKYCVSHSPVPVIVVRPERKVRKSMEKRLADPKRGRQFEELIKSRSTGGLADR